MAIAYTAFIQRLERVPFASNSASGALDHRWRWDFISNRERHLVLLIQPGQFISRTETLKGTASYLAFLWGEMKWGSFITWKAAPYTDPKQENEREMYSARQKGVLSFTRSVSVTSPGWWWWAASGWKASLWCSCRSAWGPRWCSDPRMHSTSPPEKDEIDAVRARFSWLTCVTHRSALAALRWAHPEALVDWLLCLYANRSVLVFVSGGPLHIHSEYINIRERAILAKEIASQFNLGEKRTKGEKQS